MGSIPVNENFLRLIQQNSGIIYKICHAYCPAKADHEDLAQEIIYQLWKAGKSYDDNYKFTTWMYRVALNTAISYYRVSNKNVATVAIDDTDIAAENTNNDGAASPENIRLLQLYISQLKELDKALMILYLEAKSYKEIADITGISETNVATKISRIKDKLKQKFNSHK